MYGVPLRNTPFNRHERPAFRQSMTETPSIARKREESCMDEPTTVQQVIL